MTAQRAESPYTEEYVAARLGHAGMTLLALSVPGTRPAGMRGFWPAIPGALLDDDRPGPPSAKAISAMDEALGWIRLIPEGQAKLRRLVGARALTSPKTDKPVYSWQVLGGMMGCSRVTAKTWWLDGIRLITAALNRPLFCAQFASGRAAIAELRRVQRGNSAVSGRARRALESA